MRWCLGRIARRESLVAATRLHPNAHTLNRHHQTLAPKPLCPLPQCLLVATPLLSTLSLFVAGGERGPGLIEQGPCSQGQQASGRGQGARRRRRALRGRRGRGGETKCPRACASSACNICTCVLMVLTAGLARAGLRSCVSNQVKAQAHHR